MSKGLIKALQEASPDRGVAYIAAVERHKGKSTDAFDVLVREDLVAHIEKALLNESGFHRHPHVMLRHGGGATSLYTVTVSPASWSRNRWRHGARAIVLQAARWRG